jgi:hypothetical protein
MRLLLGGGASERRSAWCVKVKTMIPHTSRRILIVDIQ